MNPNPFDDFILVQFSNPNLDQESVQYSLFDAQGKLVNQGAISAIEKEVVYQINSDNLHTGIYHLVLQNTQFKSNYKLVKK